MNPPHSPNTSTQSNETNDKRQSKVERLIENYELDELGSELEDRWTGRAKEQQSLRELADYFNRQLLESTMTDSGMTLLDGEVENIYNLLTGDEVSGGTRTQTRMRLEREGIPVDDLLSDFASYQSIYTYLTEYRDVEYPANDTTGDEQLEKETEKIQRLQTRTTAVIEDTVERMRKADNVDIGEFEVFLNAHVLCEDCGKSHELDELLNEGGCQCD